MTLPQLRRHLRNLIDYNWDKESNDFEETLDRKEDSSMHIFRDIVALDNFITGSTQTPKRAIAFGNPIEWDTDQGGAE
jgi:hypothetical protein